MRDLREVVQGAFTNFRVEGEGGGEVVGEEGCGEGGDEGGGGAEARFVGV